MSVLCVRVTYVSIFSPYLCVNVEKVKFKFNKKVLKVQTSIISLLVSSYKRVNPLLWSKPTLLLMPLTVTTTVANTPASVPVSITKTIIYLPIYIVLIHISPSKSFSLCNLP